MATNEEITKTQADWGPMDVVRHALVNIAAYSTDPGARATADDAINAMCTINKSRRDDFAKAAMQGLICSPDREQRNAPYGILVGWAAQLADALIHELDKEQKWP